MTSKERRTVTRLWGTESTATVEKRQLQTSALLKLWLSQQEDWEVEDPAAIVAGS